MSAPATAHRYVTEVIDLLAEPAPDLRQALRIARRKAQVVLDGTLAPIDRLPGADDRPHYSGKHRRHGVNVQFLTDPHGELIWAPPALPGSVHDLTATREHGTVDGLTLWAITGHADKGGRGRRRHRHSPQVEEGPQAGEAQEAVPPVPRQGPRHR
ncbi:transposase family protein [Actinomadura formosensis]|uniref:transposase family protein n=1 Tax=Actinomadura formosensis TaxID=60706 RepID=UPI00082957D0